MAQKSEWEVFFNDHAPKYDDNCFTKNTLAEVDFLVEVLGLSPGASILDVGCGTGRHSVELARRGYDVTGIDISSGMLNLAKERAKEADVEVNFEQTNAAEFEPSKEYDAVICLCEGAFGLLGSKDHPIGQPLSILSRVSSSLKPQAKCLFTVLNGYAQARKYKQSEVGEKKFDPLTLTEVSDVTLLEAGQGLPLRERGFVPTELVLLFGFAGLEVINIWGGTAGNWGRRMLELDEIEIMVVAQKSRS